MEMLRSRFREYASISDTPFCEELTLLTFGKLIDESGLLREESSSEDPDRVGKLTFRELRQAFAGSQGEASEDGSGDNDHMLRMDFPEYIEALLRISVLRFESKQLTLITKVKFILDAVSTAIPRVPVSRPGSRGLTKITHLLLT